MRPKKYSSLEVVLRIRDYDNWVRSEWIIRGDRVEMVNYWPNGQIETVKEVSMDEFYAAFQEHKREAKRAEEGKP